MDGIVFKVSTTDFEQAIQQIETLFDIFDVDGWVDVRKSKDFKQLSNFLKSMDVDNSLFTLNEI